MKKRNVVIGTRGSRLALWQANWVKREIYKRNPDIEITLEKIKTTGDKILDVPLAKVGGKGLFVKEIEEALLDKKVDLAVHSMKDVPTAFQDGLILKCITKREDPRDALISRNNVPLKDLPQGARIGTSSLRRQSQLLNFRPDFEILQLRGNLDTRLKKLEDGLYDAVILAGAGVKRLGLEEKITEMIPVEVSLPAIGQGALGIEVREDDGYIEDMVEFLNHGQTSFAVRAERAFLKRLDGGCQVPVAAYGELNDETLKLTGLVAATDGSKIIKNSISGPRRKAELMGRHLAEKLLKDGAYEILKELYDVKPPEA
ncbi:MAG: hydroxymethylbilane synthase [Deltaproteobacteria bacterium]|nr:hydroxymethylbilane synthase [Deltaproteobacteria bacterium]